MLGACCSWLAKVNGLANIFVVDVLIVNLSAHFQSRALQKDEHWVFMNDVKI